MCVEGLGAIMKVVPRPPSEEAFVPTCKDCFYHREYGNEEAVDCHRYPPTITKVEESRIVSHFPLISNGTWCGEHRVNEPSQNKMLRYGSRKESRK